MVEKERELRRLARGQHPAGRQNEPVGRKGGIYGLQAKSGRKRKAIKTEIEALGG